MHFRLQICGKFTRALLAHQIFFNGLTRFTDDMQFINYPGLSCVTSTYFALLLPHFAWCGAAAAWTINMILKCAGALCAAVKVSKLLKNGIYAFEIKLKLTGFPFESTFIWTLHVHYRFLLTFLPFSLSLETSTSWTFNLANWNGMKFWILLRQTDKPISGQGHIHIQKSTISHCGKLSRTGYQIYKTNKYRSFSAISLSWEERQF
jgi:hypothetical protein